MHFQLHKKGQERERKGKRGRERKAKIERERKARRLSEEKVRAKDQFVTSGDSAASRSSPAASLLFLLI